MTQTVPLQLVQAGLAQVLSDSLRASSNTAFGGVLVGAYLGLYTTGPPWSIGNVLGQYTEANYAGYARVPVNWGDTGIDLNGRPQAMGGCVQFQPNGSAPSNTIIGAFLVSQATGGQLIAVGQLTTSKVLGTPTDVLTIMPRYAVPGVISPVDWGEIVGVS